jgi:hypothetical protein
MEKLIKQLTSALSLKEKSDTTKIMLKILDHFMTSSSEFEDLFWLQFLNSKDITKLLSLLEDKDKNVRKITLLILVLFLLNEDSKLYFVEKCGLLTKTGKIFLTRLKYLKLNLGNTEQSIKVLNGIMNKKKTQNNGKYLFWYIPLKFENDNNLENINFTFFDKNSIDFSQKNLNLLTIPDPIYNLCGIEIFNLKERINLNNSKVSTTSKKKTQSNIKKPDRSKSPLIRDLKSPSINRRANEFLQNNKTKMNKKFASKRKDSIRDKSEQKKNISIRTAKLSVKRNDVDIKMYQTNKINTSANKTNIRKTTQITQNQYDNIFNKRRKTLYE